MSFALSAIAFLSGLAVLGWALFILWRGPRLWAIPTAYVGIVAITWAVVEAKTEGYRLPEPPDAFADTRPTEEAMDDYVGSESCRSCHPGEHDSWHASYHRTMTQLATPESVKGDFDTGFVGEFPGMNLRFSREGDEYFATYAFPKPGGVGYRAFGKRRIVMTTGSHHYQVYWTDLPWVTEEKPGDRTVWLVPYVYLFDEEQWIPRQASFLMPPTDRPESHQWNQSCVRCHATHGIERKDPLDQTHDTRTAEFGISCEACHGPGREHVEANRDPLRRYGLHRSDGGDPTIVNPARLDKERNAETCGQCHSVSVPPDPELADRYRETGKPYRPGQDLDESMLVIHPGRDETTLFEELFPKFFSDRFWSDGMVRVAGREYHGLLNTPCHQRGEMTCLTCHAMHKEEGDSRPAPDWANDQLKEGFRGNAACTQCHENLATTASLEAHTHHPAGTSGSNCMNCHMPHTTYGLLKGIRSHQIDSPSVGVTLETSRPNACNLCHLDQTLAWTADHLSEWYSQPSPALDPDQETIAASLLWLLTGDAGQRALVASAMGRPEPQEVSGQRWMPPFLAQTNFDPYHAVQIIANKSLRTLPGFSDLPRYPETQEAGEKAYSLWRQQNNQQDDDPSLLLKSGEVDRETMLRLLSNRDNTPVNLKE